MYYMALATDYDGTLAEDGRVGEDTIAALERLRRSGRRLILVTGRQLDDLERVFPRLDLFERVVAENGALLYRPGDREELLLAEKPPEPFIDRLRRLGVRPLSVGRAIVATWEPNEPVVLEAIRAQGLELQITFNKGAVMILPPGVNKASGLAAALREMELSAHNVVGVGDAENDHAFLDACGCAVAVANALDALKREVDFVTAAPRGAGVAELSDRLVATDLADLRIKRHEIPLGMMEDGRACTLPPRGESLLLAGRSGGGKSTLTTAFLERLSDCGFQFCVVDPEGDYEAFEGATVVGDGDRPPTVAQVLSLLRRADHNVIVNALAIPLADRPSFFIDLLLELQQMRARTARPHWIVVDEAHHVLPAVRGPAVAAMPQDPTRMLLITVHPDQLLPTVLERLDKLIAVGPSADETVAGFCRTIGVEPPQAAQLRQPGAAILWCRENGECQTLVTTIEPRGERKRHIRKYAKGRLGEDKSFYFRGPTGTLNLRAHNLDMFVQIAEGVDDATWLHHLRAGDYSRWIRDAIKDDELAGIVAEVERRDAYGADESRSSIRRAIEERYTGPAD